MNHRMDAAADSAGYREIGRVVGVKGVRGELRIAPETDDPNRILGLSSVQIGDDFASSTLFDVKSAAIQPTKRGPTVVVVLDGVNDRSQADTLRKKFVYALESDLPPLAPGEFFVGDLVGLVLETEDGLGLGIVVDVLDMPAQQIVLARVEDGREIMIPIVPDFIKSIDFKHGRLIVSLIEGIL